MPPNKNNDIFDDSAMIKAIQEAFSGIQQQGFKPNTMIMHPDTWEDTKEIVMPPAYGLSAEEIVSTQPMVSPSALLLWRAVPTKTGGMEYVALEPVILKNRWEDILDE